jgi:hypothetical protein
MIGSLHADTTDIFLQNFPLPNHTKESELWLNHPPLPIATQVYWKRNVRNFIPPNEKKKEVTEQY